MDLAQLLRDEAIECRRSAENSGRYSDAFYVTSIVLDSMATRLELQAKATTEDPSRSLEEKS